MRKTVPVLALIAFACDFSARDVLVHGDLARKSEAVLRSDGYQEDPRGQFDGTETPRRSIEDRGHSNEPVGKWRSNGEAVEPKWRDGDSVPLLPFSHYRSYSRDDEVDDAEHEEYPVTSRRPFKYRYSIDRPNRPRESPERRFPIRDDYDVTYRDRDFDDRDHDYPRKRRRPLKNPHGSMIYDETVQNAANSDGKRGRNIVDASSNNQEVTSKYREAFQAREYAHEFNDEEYLRPRPRKRRPPQNYEFALANAAASSEAPEDPSESSLRLKTSENPPITTQSSDNNAIELKMLLKMQQEEGSSLSEILQRKNLTLNDLLEGKADVINALKSKIADIESEEYIEEMSKELSTSLMKLAATATPFTESAQMSTIHESTTTSAVVSNILNSATTETTSFSNNISKNHGKISSSNTRIIKKELEDVEKVTQSLHDFLPSKATTSTVISTVITTTSTPSPVAMNSMEYFLNDDGNTESTSDQRSAARLENFDEDEIMEFSDFMDFKKGKSQAAPVLLNLPSEKVAPQQSSSRDLVSTLSIEHILQSTERIKLMKNSRDNRDDTTENGKKAIQDDAVSLDETSMEDYNAFIGAEYQNDAPIDIIEEDRRQSGETKYDLNIYKNGAPANPIEKQQIENPDNDRRESYDKNHSTEYHQVNRVTVENTRALENHRDTNGRRYEDIISEIEPEARAEIFELFASGSAGKRLERLLKSRNMSVEELIALRQRGSSKVHLTEMSRLQVSGPKRLQTSKASDINNKDIISFSSINKFKDSLQHLKNENNSEKEEDKKNQFRQDIVSYLHDPLFDRDLENTSLSKLLDLVEHDKNASRKIMFQKESQEDTVGSDQPIGLENPHRAIEIVDLLTMFGSLPFAKDAHRQFGTEVDNEEEAKPPIDNDDALLIGDEDNTVRLNTSNKFHDGYVEEIVREQPNIVKTIYSETISNEEENKTLLRLKPSIITSSVILGVTIIVFLAIFIVCRIRQKQRYIYRNTFSRTVFQSPITAARKLSNSSSLSTVMVNVAATSTTRRPERTEMQETVEEFDSKSDMDNDSLDANDSWETIPDYAK